MSTVRTDPAGHLIAVSTLSQYLYCARRCWYYRFFAPGDRSAALVDGQAKHATQTRRPGWLREQYFRSQKLGLHGSVDVIDRCDGGGADQSTPVPVERKRAASGQYYWDDEVQVTAYGLLLEECLESVDKIDYGIVYLASTDERHRIELTDCRREAVRTVRDEVRALAPDQPPAPVENRNKCNGCSVRHHCQPSTEMHLDGRADDILSKPAGETDE